MLSANWYETVTEEQEKWLDLIRRVFQIDIRR